MAARLPANPEQLICRVDAIWLACQITHRFHPGPICKQRAPFLSCLSSWRPRDEHGERVEQREKPHRHLSPMPPFSTLHYLALSRYDSLIVRTWVLLLMYPARPPAVQNFALPLTSLPSLLLGLASLPERALEDLEQSWRHAASTSFTGRSLPTILPSLLTT